MPETRFSYLSDIEFERELETRYDHTGQLVLGHEMAQELLERIRRWVEIPDQREIVEELESEIDDLEQEIRNIEGDA